MEKKKKNDPNYEANQLGPRALKWEGGGEIEENTDFIFGIMSFTTNYITIDDTMTRV